MATISDVQTAGWDVEVAAAPDNQPIVYCVLGPGVIVYVRADDQEKIDGFAAQPPAPSSS